MIGFYQCCLSYLLVEDMDDQGNIVDISDEFVFLIHKESKAIRPSDNPDFKYQINR